MNVNKPNTNLKVTVSSLTQTKSIRNHLALFSPRDAPTTRGDDGNKMVETRQRRRSARASVSAAIKNKWTKGLKEVDLLCENNLEHIAELKPGLMERRERCSI